jgi:hypothetical protein
MPRLRPLALGLVLLSGLLRAPPAAAQHPADSVRAAALRDFHGPDLRGKDGPLAKVGLDLLLLYHEYRTARARGDSSFAPSVPGVQVSDGRVTIDAVATDTARVLRAELRALGLTDAATAGRIVSGRLPIEQIPALAEIPSLRGVLPSRMRTRSRRSAPRSPCVGGPPPSDSSPPGPDSAAAPAPPGSGAMPDGGH